MVSDGKRESTSVVYRVNIKGNGDVAWKPNAAMEKDLRNTVPDGNSAGRETAAWEIAKHLGIGDLVPTTVHRDMNGRSGSAQRWLPAEEGWRKASEDLARAAAYDFVIGNTDRHSKNWMVNGDKIGLIDHGLAFPDRHGSQTSNVDIIKKAEPLRVPKEADSWYGKWRDLEASMVRNGLGKNEIDLTLKRLRHVADAGRFGQTIGQLRKSLKSEGWNPQDPYEELVKSSVPESSSPSEPQESPAWEHRQHPAGGWGVVKVHVDPSDGFVFPQWGKERHADEAAAKKRAEELNNTGN